jgi:acetylornithine deacetylase/succinyl-diaminopimelate desuccinylase-like protein
MMPNKSISFILGWFLFLPGSVWAQESPSLLKTYLKGHQGGMIQEYLNFVSIPNETNDSSHILQNAAFIQKMLKDRGLNSELLNTENGNPVVFAEYKSPGSKRTLNFYAHYDGQPVNPKQWAPGLKPFDPVFINRPMEQGGKILDYKPGDSVSPEWRLSGRGSADDKAGVMCILNAWEALQKTKTQIHYNLKFFFEGEEERGSPHLAEIFKKYKEKLGSDLWIIIDGPRHPTGRKTISFGVRGDVNIGLTVYGGLRPLHSGNYGNWAPNPGIKLAKILASMKNDSGKVIVKGFYEDMIPISAVEREAIQAIPPAEEGLKKELALASPEGPYNFLFEAVMYPTLNINGMASGNIGSQAANIIPTKAQAVLDLRLVPGNEVDKQVEKVRQHIRSLGYYITDKEPSLEERLSYANIVRFNQEKGGYKAQRTPMNLPITQRVIHAVQSTSKDPLVLIPSAGGSLPLYIFEKELDARVITIPLVNYDNNQHAENENVKIRYLWEGIETIASVMQMPAQ